MTHIVTSLCVRDRGCIEVCRWSVVPGQPLRNGFGFISIVLYGAARAS
jgi:hypothetical protein